MSPPRYRAAIIGTGRIASLLERDPLRGRPHTHAGWYAAYPRTDLVAGCDVDEQRLHAFGADWNLPAEALFRDYREMLRQVRPDIVSICAYAPERRAMVEAAVEGGVRGLWIEKAVACSIQEARALLHAITSRGVVAVVDQPRRVDPRFLGVKALIGRRDWGALESVHCLMSGHLMHTGIHAWDVLGLWCGNWVSAAAWLAEREADALARLARQGRGGAAPLRPHVPDGADVQDRGGCAHVQFANGTHAFVSGGLKQYFVFQFDLVFEGGRLRLGNDVDECLRPAPSPRYSGFVELASSGAVPRCDGGPSSVLLDLVEAMDARREPHLSVRHALQAFGLGVALFQSHLEGHRHIRPEEVRDDLYVASL